MNVFKSIILLTCAAVIFHSCSFALQNKYEDPLSLTTEEFEKTVVGVWKCVCAGTNYSWDENEEYHISKGLEIPVDLDYVEITSDAVRFKFKSPIPLLTYEDYEGNFTVSYINEMNYPREGHTIISDKYFDNDAEGIEGYFLRYYPNPPVQYHTYINAYGKSEKHADRLIIGLETYIYFECERM